MSLFSSGPLPQSSTTLFSQSSTSRASSRPTDSSDQSVLPSTLTQFYPINTGTAHSGGSLSSRGAFAVAFAMAGILLLILITIFMSCRQYRRNQLLQARARDRCTSLHHKSSTIGRRHSCERKSFHGGTDENTLEHTESGFVIQGLTKERSDVGEGTCHGTEHLHSGGIAPASTVTRWGPDAGDRQIYRQKLQQIPSDKSPTATNHSSTITPPRAYLPSPHWRLSPCRPLSPLIHPAVLSVEGDEDSVYQLSTLQSVGYPETTAGSNQSDNCDTSAKEPGPSVVHGTCPMASPDLEDYQGYNVSPTNSLRRALSMRTMLDVHVRESKAV